jgi:hypothetical protein
MRFKYTPEEVMKKHPRIVAHLIAESLGYFTPRSAAIAIIKAKNNEPYYCEWYTDCAGRYGDMLDKKNVARVTKEVLEQAIKYRHVHKGYMSDYKKALEIVKKAIEGNEPTFASWF